MRKNAKLIAALLACASLAGCRTGEEGRLQYVNVSQVMCSFPGEGSEPLAIAVEALPTEWSAEAGASWVQAERTDANTLTVRVEDNDTGAERREL